MAGRDSVSEQMRLMNPHWEGGFSYEYPFERRPLRWLLGAMGHRLILSINGPRRVGKTVLMKQLIQSLLSRRVPRQNVLYFSFDESDATPLQVIRAWEAAAGKKARGERFFAFFDEIQNVESWAPKVKALYDNLGIKIAISGSAAMDIRKGNESLAGRIAEIFVPPLSFPEYLMFSRRGRMATEQAAADAYPQYMQRQLPELAAAQDLSPKEYASSIVKKAIYEDARKYFKVEELDVVDGMFKVICCEPGQVISSSDIGRDFGISRQTASAYLLALEKGFLARKLYNFSRNARKTEVRSKKFYPLYTTLAAYAGTADEAHIAETEVAFQTGAEFFWNDKGKEIDFIAGAAHDCGIEVKMRRSIDGRDVKWLLKDRLGLKRRVLVAPLGSDVSVKGAEVVPFHRIGEFSKSLLSKTNEKAENSLI
jgi:predicted AAA+ superfamily ATPase